MGGSDCVSFSYAERNEFQRAFEAMEATLPKVFRPFLHRWAEESGPHPTFIIYAEDGSAVLRLSRVAKESYRSVGITKSGTVIYTLSASSIRKALRSAGLL